MNRSIHENQSNNKDYRHYYVSEEEKCKILRFKADTHVRQGRTLYRERKYNEAITQFKTSLKLRESFIGRYDTFTAGVYFFLGNCYYQIEDYENALVAYRTRLRIRRHLNHDDPSSPSMDDRMIMSLKRTGMTEKQIKAYDLDLIMSLRHEKIGDEFREQAEFKKAIFKYKRSVAIEKKWSGADVTVAFLWRKIAFLVDRMNDIKLTRSPFDWAKADCINGENSQRVNMRLEPMISATSTQETSIKTPSVTSRKAMTVTTTGISSSSPSDNDKRDNESLNGPQQQEQGEPSEDHVCVFQALRNLSSQYDHVIDWKKVLQCVDVKVNIEQAKKEMKREEKIERKQQKEKRWSIIASPRLSYSKTEQSTSPSQSGRLSVVLKRKTISVFKTEHGSRIKCLLL